jgi:hypothetical protein
MCCYEDQRDVMKRRFYGLTNIYWKYLDYMKCLVVSRKLVVPWFGKGVRATAIHPTMLQHMTQMRVNPRSPPL